MFKYFLVLLGILLNTSILGAKEKISVAAFEYPPIYQNDKDKGLSGDIVVAAFNAVNIDVDMQFFPVLRMVKSVSDGDVVCGIGGSVLFSGPDVAANVTVSSVIQNVYQTFLYNTKKYPNGLSYENISDMSKYNIGVLNGSGIHKFLSNNKELKLDVNTSHEGTAKQLQMDRVNAWATVDLTGIMYMKKLFPEESANYKYTKAFNLGDVSLVFSKKKDPNNIYNNKFIEGLSIIKKNGVFMQIFAKYYGSKAAINKGALPKDMQ